MIALNIKSVTAHPTRKESINESGEEREKRRKSEQQKHRREETERREDEREEKKNVKSCSGIFNYSKK